MRFFRAFREHKRSSECAPIDDDTDTRLMLERLDDKQSEYA